MSKKKKTDLITVSKDAINEIISYAPEHKEMLTKIQENLPQIHKSTSLFGKTQSQFMDNMLTVSHPSPLRNIRQILAEINKAKEALKEAHFKNKKKEIRMQIKLRDAEKEKDELKKELILVEVDELRSQLESGQVYISGAIRKIRNYIEQYNSILNKLKEEKGIEDFNEIDFEEEEERYHIMKAFMQGLDAARSHHGTIDEGNQIYFSQIGINGSHAQYEVTQYLREEQELFKQGKAPTHNMTLNFLNRMAEIFKGCSSKYAEYKGMKTFTEEAALIKGDERLLLTNKKKKNEK